MVRIILKGMNGAEDTYIRAYYDIEFKKVSEETKTVRAYEWKNNAWCYEDHHNR